MEGGDVFKPVKPMVFGCGVHGFDKDFVGLVIFSVGRVVRDVTVSIGYVTEVVLLFFEG